ncbi:MAG: response regulator [Planctomycetota bacterium]
MSVSTMPTLELPQRILIVDDDAAIRRILVRAFSKSAKVQEAKDGAEGLIKIHDWSPEFVITDLMMPVIDGLEMIVRARETASGACLPILVLTACGEERLLLECFQKGADDYMVKPFSVEELRIRVSSIYMRQNLARDVNPLTRLPGNIVLKREINSRIQKQKALAIAYIDIDHFKAFNDKHGFDRGDVVLQLLGDLLGEFSRNYPPGEVFVGHVGGDDFVVILPLGEVQRLADRMHISFCAATRMFYSPEEVKSGVTRVKDRLGKVREVPLLSLSIGVVNTEREGMTDLRKVSQVAAEVKNIAKQSPGNSLFIDRRKE